MNNIINEHYFEIFPHLESERLVYREFKIKDATEIFAIRSNNLVMQFMDSNRHESINDSEEFVLNNITSYKEKKGFFWAIIEKSTDQFIGDFSFWRLDRVNARAEIGYSLKSDFWGNGYMKEAMHTLIRFGFKELKLHSFEANINPNNEASRNVLRRIGFKKEAYFRENYFYNGNFLDSEIHSLLEKDIVY